VPFYVNLLYLSIKFLLIYFVHYFFRKRSRAIFRFRILRIYDCFMVDRMSEYVINRNDEETNKIFLSPSLFFYFSLLNKC